MQSRVIPVLLLFCLSVGPVVGQKLDQRLAFQKLSGTKEECAIAIEMLATIGKPAVPTAIQILRGRGAANRLQYEKTIEACGRIGPDAASAVPTLMGELRPGAQFRKHAITSLGQIGPKASRAVPTLKRILQAPTDQFNEFDVVIEALQRIGPKAKSAAPEIIRIMEGGRSPDRCARALAALGATEIIPDLIKRLGDTTGRGITQEEPHALLDTSDRLLQQLFRSLRLRSPGHQ